MPRKKRDSAPLVGFPVGEPFQSMAEVDRYLAGNLIQCRECGHSFRSLPRHITVAHGLSAEDYKERHGIPWKRGLVSGALHDELSQLAYDLDSLAKVKGKGSRQRGSKIQMRGYCRARRNARMTYSEEQYFALAQRVANGEALAAVCRESGMPSADAVRLYRQFNKNYDEFFRKEVEPNLLPWSALGRENLVAGRVEAAIAMARNGARARDIADATGYCEANARLFLKGTNWRSVRDGSKPAVHDPRPHTLKLRRSPTATV